MVYKVSKGGVRSGNTLRGLHSRRTKRYSRQACMIGRSNLNHKDIPALLETSFEDSKFSSNLLSTDVLLSLNKKERWRLPATVSHMIKTGSFDEGKTMVSLLERHKLKRRANCVSFVCNKGKTRQVTPRQKGYFSYNLDNIDLDVSKRQIRRQKAELIRTMKSTKEETVNDKKEKVKTIEVFTVSGYGKVGDRRKCLVSYKPEYRLEVFYPCPQSCSLVYNPKYTNAHIEFGEEGNMEMKSNSKSSNRRRRYRKPFTSKDLKLYKDEIDSMEQADFWDEYSDDCDTDTESDASCQEGEDIFKQSLSVNDEDYGNECDGDVSCFQENLFVTLIAEAEKAKSLCENKKYRRQRKSSSKSSDISGSLSNNEDKSHIVYTNVKNPWVPPRKKRLPKTKKQKKMATTIPTSQETKAATHDAAVTTTPLLITLHAAQVILESTETSPESLRTKFGNLYAEAESEPRRFVINVTDDVQNLLSSSRNAEQDTTFMSFLVFIYDGLYDEGLDTFKVIFNSNICTHTNIISKNISFQKTSIEQIMNQVVCVLLDMKEEGELYMNNRLSCWKSTNSAVTLLNDLFRVNVETFHAYDEIKRISNTGALQEHPDLSIGLSSIVKNLDFEIFCDICYENINPVQTGAVSGTKLCRCSHIFCDDCWRSHFRAKFKDGALKMVCPGYGCEEVVGPVTLLSLLHVSEVCQLFQRICQEEAESSPNCRWCPNPYCGRIIRLDSDKTANDVSLDVTCACGHEFCFSCQSQPHWPATCEQAEDYREKLDTIKPLKDAKNDFNLEEDKTASLAPNHGNKVEILEIEGRVCPKCSKFINKNGGCDHMLCKCGFYFCWQCCKDLANHTVCTPNSLFAIEHTRKMKVRHLTIPNVFNLDGETDKTPKVISDRQKATLYQKAFQERLDAKYSKKQRPVREMVRKISHIAQKDLLLKREILTICGVNTDNMSDATILQSAFASHVTKFLRSCYDIKRALHHVAEFTFVLLQDTPDSVERRRAYKLANDLSSYCTFIKSVMDLGQEQNMLIALKRLQDIQAWAKRALTVLLATVDKLKY